MIHLHLYFRLQGGTHPFGPGTFGGPLGGGSGITSWGNLRRIVNVVWVNCTWHITSQLQGGHVAGRRQENHGSALCVMLTSRVYVRMSHIGY